MSILRAILVAWRVSAWRERVKFALCASCVTVLVGAAGAALRPARTVTVTKAAETVADESAGLDLRVHKIEEQKPVERTKTRIVYRTGPVQERIVERERTGGSTTTTDTGAKVKDDLHVEQKVTERTVTAPEGRWSVRVLAGLDTGGSVVAGAGVDFRLVGPVTLGAWALAPVAGAPGRFAGGVSAGLRLP